MCSSRVREDLCGFILTIRESPLTSALFSLGFPQHAPVSKGLFPDSSDQRNGFFSELYVLVPPWQCNFIGRDGLRASMREKKKISPFLVHCLEIGVSLGVSANCYTPCGVSQFSPPLAQSWGENKVNSPSYRLLFFKL